MTIAHKGHHPTAPTRDHILICICECGLQHVPATFSEIRERLGVSTGTITHHTKTLVVIGFIVPATTAGNKSAGFTLTDAGYAYLLEHGWLTSTTRVITFGLSETALELLENGRAAGLEDAQ